MPEVYYPNLITLFYLFQFSYHPHIICIVETWLSNEIDSTEIDIPGYQLYRKDRNRQGGGILMYIANCMLVSLFPDPGPHLELITLSAIGLIILNLICVCFIAPQALADLFLIHWPLILSLSALDPFLSLFF